MWYDRTSLIERGNNMIEATETLYADTEFGKWLDAMPSNVKSNYSEFSVDMHGTRVEVLFWIDEEE